MKIERLELRRIALDLVTPFRTSFGVETHRDILLLRVTTDVGEGWGECVASHEPAYSSEFVDGAALVITQHLWPAADVRRRRRRRRGAAQLARFKGHPDVEGGARDGGARRRVARLGHEPAGEVGLDARSHPEWSQRRHLRLARRACCARSSGYVDDGYVRIKLKIEPGWDVEPVRLVRELIGPDTPLQVDANTAYGRDDIAHLCKLDEFDLLLIEQPLPEEDILGHAQLARASATPVCLDESIVSVHTAVDAIDLGAAEIINIKPGRVGGYLDSGAHPRPVCRARCARCGAVAWSRPASAAPPTPDWPRCPASRCPATSAHRPASTPATSCSTRSPSTTATSTVPTTPGLGFELDHDFLDCITTSTVELTT